MKFGINSPVHQAMRQSPNLEVNPNFVNLWELAILYKRFVSCIQHKIWKIRGNIDYL
jgi:hypothetical protein